MAFRSECKGDRLHWSPRNIHPKTPSVSNEQLPGMALSLTVVDLRTNPGQVK